MSAHNSSSPPGPTASNPTCRPICAAANKASTWQLRYEPGRLSCVCVAVSGTSPPTNNPNPPSTLRSLASWPGSCGPSSPSDMTTSVRPSRRSMPTTVGPPATRQPPADADPIPDRSLLSGNPGREHRVGLLLRIHTVRSQPANMRLAMARSTTRLARPVPPAAKPPPTPTGSAIT